MVGSVRSESPHAADLLDEGNSARRVKKGTVFGRASTPPFLEDDIVEKQAILALEK
jgi:hypothetical protein